LAVEVGATLSGSAGDVEVEIVPMSRVVIGHQNVIKKLRGARLEGRRGVAGVDLTS
jgi:hypothetical protein